MFWAFRVTVIKWRVVEFSTVQGWPLTKHYTIISFTEVWRNLGFAGRQLSKSSLIS